MARSRYRREWMHGLRTGGRWIHDPSDLANAFDFFLSLAGPLVDREFRRFARHETGRKLLAMDPRPDLNAVLGDREALAAMPEGSLGRAYLEYLGPDEMMSPQVFLDAARVDELGRRFGWSDDHVWFMKRMSNSHDVFHVVSGYGTDLVGEAGVIAFTYGQLPIPSLLLAIGALSALDPTDPVGWSRFLRAAYRRGRDMESLSCVDYESWFERPLEELREHVGLRPERRAHPGGIPRPSRLARRLERVLEKKGEARYAAAAA